MRLSPALVVVVTAVLLVAACSKAQLRSAPPSTPAPGAAEGGAPLDLYAADRPGQLSPTVASFPSRLYVPNSESNTVDVIDPATMHIVDHFDVGAEPQHVVPSYHMKTLYVAS